MASSGQGGSREAMMKINAENNTGEAFGQVQRDAAEAAKSMRLFATSFAAHRLGTALRDVGDQMGKVAKSAFQDALEWERGMALVTTQTDEGGAAMNRLSKQALKLAKTSEVPFEEIQEGLYDVLSSMDVSAKGAMTITEQVTKAAIAGNADVRETTRAAVGALNAFGLEASDTGHVLDVQFQLVRKGVGTYSDFLGVLGDVYPSAVAAGQSLEDVSGALAFTTRNGLNASKAGISVARALDMITRPQYSSAIKNVLGVDVVDEATGNFRRIGDIIRDMGGVLGELSEPDRKEVLADIFGSGEIRASRFFNIAITKFGDLNNMIDQFSDEKVNGTMKKAWTTMTDTVGHQLTRLRNLVTGIGISMATKFLPQLASMGDLAKQAGEWFDKLPDGVQGFIGALFLLSTAFAMVGGRFLLFMSNVMGTQALMKLAGVNVRTMAATMVSATLPILGYALAFAAVAGAIAFVINKWDMIRNEFKKARSWINPVTFALSLLAAALIIKVIPAFTLWAWYLGGLIKAQIAAFVTGLKTMVTGLVATGGAAAALSAALTVGLAVAIYFVVQAFMAWKTAQEEHAKSLQATQNLHGAFLDQMKVGVRTTEETVANIKKTLNDESLSWDERNEIVAKNLRQVNDWVRAGGKVVESGKTSVGALRKQIAVSESLGQSTDALRKKVVVFAGMTYDKFHEWRRGTVNAINGVRGAFDNLVAKTKVSGDQIVRQFQRGLEKTREWGKDFRALLRHGIPDDMAVMIQEQGVASSAFVSELVDMARNNKEKFNAIKSDWRSGQQESNRISRLVGQDIGGIGNASNTVKGKVDSLAQSLRNIPSEVVVNFRLNGLPGQIPTTNLDVGNVGGGEIGSGSGGGMQGGGPMSRPVASEAAPVVQNFYVTGRPDERLAKEAAEEMMWVGRTRGYAS